MSTRPPQPPAKQFITRRRASDKELLELYFQEGESMSRCSAIKQRIEDAAKVANDELEAERRIAVQLSSRIALAKELLNIPVVAVMNPSKNEKTLFWPEDTAFENPIETVPIKPEDYELPLL